jgi:DNA-binding MarR family transcriptional regulator
VLVGAPPVQQDERSAGIARRGPQPVGERLYTDCVGNYTVVRPLDREELAAWRGLLRTHASLTRALDDELTSGHGLPLSSYEVLLRLDDAPAGRLRMSELADPALLSRSGVSRLVDRLEQDGLLRREKCHDDGRGAFAAITPSGRRLLDEARDTHLAGVRRLFLERLSGAELRLLGELWARFEPR